MPKNKGVKRVKDMYDRFFMRSFTYFDENLNIKNKKLKIPSEYEHISTPLEETLENLIFILRQAQNGAWLVRSSSSLPVRPVLDVMIDLCLTLSSLYREGTQESYPENPSLKEGNYPDPLGNLPLIRQRRPSRTIWSEHLGTFFRDLAHCLVSIEQTREVPNLGEFFPMSAKSKQRLIDLKEQIQDEQILLFSVQQLLLKTLTSLQCKEASLSPRQREIVTYHRRRLRRLKRPNKKHQ